LIECSLCKQTFEEDELLEQRKRRHEQGRHSHHSVVGRYGTKESKSGMGGLILGKVEWRKI
jgi:hypothetical protein